MLKHKVALLHESLSIMLIIIVSMLPDEYLPLGIIISAIAALIFWVNFGILLEGKRKND